MNFCKLLNKESPSIFFSELVFLWLGDICFFTNLRNNKVKCPIPSAHIEGRILAVHKYTKGIIFVYFSNHIIYNRGFSSFSKSKEPCI